MIVVRPFRGAQAVRQLMFSADGSQLFFAGNRGDIGRYDLTTGAAEDLALSDENLASFTLLPDRDRLIYYTQASLRLRDLATADDRPWPIRGARQPVVLQATNRQGMLACISPWRQEMAANIRIIDLAGQQLRRVIRDVPYATSEMALSPDGKLVAVVQDPHSWGARTEPDSERYVTIFSRSDGNELSSFRGFVETIHALRFAPDGKSIAVAAGSVLTCIGVKGSHAQFAVSAANRHIAALEFMPEGGRILTIHTDGTVRVNDVQTGHELRSYDFQIGRLSALAVAPNGLAAAVGGADGCFVVWDLEG